MGLQTFEEDLDYVLSTDIYGLGWYTFYLLEARKEVHDELVNRVYLLIKAITEGNEGFLHVLLYDRENAVGILLGYYILLKRRFYGEHHLQRGLSEVLKIVINNINEYTVKGEILYVLKKLDLLTDRIRNIFKVDDKIIAELNKLENILLTADQRIEDLESLLYIIWIAYETRIYDRSKEQDLLKIFLDERLYNIIVRDYKSISAYVGALSNFILHRRLKLKKEQLHILYKRFVNLKKMVGLYVKELEQKLEQKETIDIALVGKLKLSDYYLEKTLRKIKILNEIQKIKRILGIPLVLILGVIALFLKLLTMMPQVILPFLLLYGDHIAYVLLFVMLVILDYLKFEGKIFKWFKKNFKILISLIHLK
jgi:hypothetical protein